MNTYVSVTVNRPVNPSILCAYNTLLSFEKIKDAYLEEIINTAYAKFTYVVNLAKRDIACLVTAQSLDNTSCVLTITANVVDMSSIFEGGTHEFAAEFLKRFSQAVKESNV